MSLTESSESLSLAVGAWGVSMGRMVGGLKMKPAELATLLKMRPTCCSGLSRRLFTSTSPKPTSLLLICLVALRWWPRRVARRAWCAVLRAYPEMRAAKVSRICLIVVCAVVISIGLSGGGLWKM